MHYQTGHDCKHSGSSIWQMLSICNSKQKRSNRQPQQWQLQRKHEVAPMFAIDSGCHHNSSCHHHHHCHHLLLLPDYTMFAAATVTLETGPQKQVMSGKLDDFSKQVGNSLWLLASKERNYVKHKHHVW